MKRKHLSALLIIIGTISLLQHILVYGYFELLDLVGHEWLGIVLILTGIILVVKKGEWSIELKEWLKKQ